jgi:hypothetical protein
MLPSSATASTMSSGAGDATYIIRAAITRASETPARTSTTA